ncbi:MAG: OmpH family outer membrane protein [Bacteroidia bacterium]
MQKSSWIGFITLALLVGSLAFWQYQSRTKTAYIELQKVYEAFDMKKELEGKFSGVQQQRKIMLDSMEMHLRVLSSKLEVNAQKTPEEIASFNAQREVFLQKQQEFDQDNAAVQQQYMAQVLKQLNEYVREYGKDQGYQYVFGAEGSGVIMYAEESQNITAPVIVFVNDRYKGKK